MVAIGPTRKDEDNDDNDEDDNTFSHSEHEKNLMSYLWKCMCQYPPIGARLLQFLIVATFVFDWTVNS